ncbi:O-antigen ligase family protein [Methylophilaceae bacterium]|nr:O-antigen ligase family protein [Methylophilaceae bacterium]
MLNNISPKLKYLLPISLPLLLIFFRGIADVTVLMIGLIFLYRSYKINEWQWVKQRWFIFSLIFWLYLLLINSPLSTNSSESALYSLAFIRWPLFAMAISLWLLNNHNSQKYFLISLAATFLFITLDVWWQYFFNYDLFGNPKFTFNTERLTGPFRNNPMPGIFMARYFFLLLYLGYFIKYIQTPTKNITFIFLVLLIGILSIYITGERMALIIFISGTSLVSIGLLLQYKKIRKYIYFGLFLILGFLAIAQQAFPNLNDRMITDLLHKLSNFSSSDYMLVFKSAYAVWMESPIFGVGFHQYRESCIALGYWGTSGGVCMHPHNISLELLSETGMTGFILYYLIIISVAIKVINNFFYQKNWLSLFLSLNLLFVSFLPVIGGMSLFNNWIGAIVWLFLGWALAFSKKNLN